MNIQERLQIFFRRLEAAPPAKTAEKAMALVCHLIEEVEDEFCPLPRENPPPKYFTGRMYAPQPDHIKPMGGGLKARALRHVIYCAADGEITIIYLGNKTIVASKPGKNL